MRKLSSLLTPVGVAFFAISAVLAVRSVLYGMGCETTIHGSGWDLTVDCHLDGCTSCYVQEFVPPERPRWMTCVCSSGSSNMQCCHLVLFGTSDPTEPPYPLPSGDCDAPGCDTSGTCVRLGTGSAIDPWRVRCETPE